MSEDKEVGIYNRNSSEDMHLLAVESKDATITVHSKQEKSYLQYLKEKGKYSVKGLRSRLRGMREYQKWLNTCQKGQEEVDAS